MRSTGCRQPDAGVLLIHPLATIDTMLTRIKGG
jgi:hypothetical protein